MPFWATVKDFAFGPIVSAAASPLYYQIALSNWTGYWSNYWSVFAASNASVASPTFSTFGSIAGTNREFGCVMAANGKVIGIPASIGSNVYIDTLNSDAIGSFGSGVGNAYNGGALAADGKIYTVPGSGSFAQIDPVALTSTVYTPATSGGWTSVNGGWNGAVLAPSGKIYCPPTVTTAPNVFCIIPGTSPTACNVPTANGPALTTTASNSFWGGVLAPNGYIYFMPTAGSSIMKFNPSNETYTLISVTSGGNTLGLGASTFRGVVLHQNGVIYTAINTGSNMLTFDTNTDTPRTVTPQVGGANLATTGWFGGSTGPDGKIYFAPYNATYILQVTPTSTTTITCAAISSFSTGGTKYRGMTLAPNGNIYTFPYASSTAGKLTFSPSALPSSDFCCTPYINTGGN
jgi:hypothetical protein